MWPQLQWAYFKETICMIVFCECLIAANIMNSGHHMQVDTRPMPKMCTVHVNRTYLLFYVHSVLKKLIDITVHTYPMCRKVKSDDLPSQIFKSFFFLFIVHQFYTFHQVSDSYRSPWKLFTIWILQELNTGILCYYFSILAIKKDQCWNCFNLELLCKFGLEKY